MLVQVHSSSFMKNLRCQMICESKLLSYYLAKSTSTKNSPRSSQLLCVFICCHSKDQVSTVFHHSSTTLFHSVNEHLLFRSSSRNIFTKTTQFVILLLHHIRTVPPPKYFIFSHFPNALLLTLLRSIFLPCSILQ